MFLACDTRGMFDTPLPYDGPFGAPEHGEYWTDDNLYKNGPLNDIEMSYKIKLSIFHQR